MSFSIKAFLKSHCDTADAGHLLFYYQSVLKYNSIKGSYYTCFFDKALILILDSKVIEKVPYTYIKISKSKDNKVLKFNWKAQGQKKKLKIPFEKENLLLELYKSIKSKIEVEHTNSKRKIYGTRSSLSINTTPFFAAVEFSNINFILKSDLSAGIDGLKRSILMRLSDHFYPNYNSSKNINLSIFESMNIFLRIKKVEYIIKTDEDLRTASAYMDNRLDLVLKK